MKKIYAVNGSFRKNFNTAQVLQRALDGAAAAGAETELINLRGKKVAGCLGCKYCHEHDGECVQKDDMKGILNFPNEVPSQRLEQRLSALTTR